MSCGVETELEKQCGWNEGPASQHRAGSQEVRMNAFDRELRRGALELLLLKLLSREDMYGYQLVSTLSGSEEEKGVKIKEGTLYPILYRLEDRGWIESYRDTPERGVPRKYYRLTDAGQKACDDLEEQWNRFRESVDRFLKKEE